jgi:transcription initiation factor IIE alpha subunit
MAAIIEVEVLAVVESQMASRIAKVKRSIAICFKVVQYMLRLNGVSKNSLDRQWQTQFVLKSSRAFCKINW